MFKGLWSKIFSKKNAKIAEEKKIIEGDGFFASLTYGHLELESEMSIRSMMEELEKKGIVKPIPKDKKMQNLEKHSKQKSRY